MINKITDSIIYVGVNDKTIDLFESQYKVPNGISYNSYIIKDEKTVIMDTVDKRATDEWTQNIENVLKDEKPDYLVISHLEPDHSYNIEMLCEKYPEMKIIGNAKTFAFIPQFFKISNLQERQVIVKEGDKINIGNHTLNFIMAPMVHWPEVMFTYEENENVLFTADAFGKFGDLDCDEDWLDEARRYYINIVGRYGLQVQAVLKKIATLKINKICPLHGPVLTDNLEYYINKYNIWSSYEKEDDGIFIAYASIHGNTAEAVRKLADLFESKGEKVFVQDLSRCDMSEALSNAHKYGKLVLAAPTYNFGIFTPMKEFLMKIKDNNLQNRIIGIVENGTWAPCVAKEMSDILSTMKNITIAEPTVTIKTRLHDENISQMHELVENMMNV